MYACESRVRKDVVSSSSSMRMRAVLFDVGGMAMMICISFIHLFVWLLDKTKRLRPPPPYTKTSCSSNAVPLTSCW